MEGNDWMERAFKYRPQGGSGNTGSRWPRRPRSSLSGTACSSARTPRPCAPLHTARTATPPPRRSPATPRTTSRTTDTPAVSKKGEQKSNDKALNRNRKEFLGVRWLESHLGGRVDKAAHRARVAVQRRRPMAPTHQRTRRRAAAADPVAVRVRPRPALRKARRHPALQADHV